MVRSAFALLCLAGVLALFGCGHQAQRLAPARWSQASKIPAAGPLSAVSCPTTSFCVAVGGGQALTYSDGTWTAPKAIDTHRSINDGLVTVSCPSPTFCVAGDEDGFVLAYNGRTWSSPVLIAKAGLSQLSCGSASFCGAVDTDGDALFFNGSAWSSPHAIPESSQPSAISCTSGGVCMAVDGGGAGTYHFADGTWTSAGQLGVSTPSGGSEPNVGSAVACTSSSSCAALDNFGEAFTLNNGRWSGPTGFDSNLMDGADAVSCASEDRCVLVDEEGVTSTWNGHAWSAAKRIDGVDADLSDVSCPSARFCVAVDARGQAVTYH